MLHLALFSSSIWFHLVTKYVALNSKMNHKNDHQTEYASDYRRVLSEFL